VGLDIYRDGTHAKGGHQSQFPVQTELDVALLVAYIKPATASDGRKSIRRFGGTKSLSSRRIIIYKYTPSSLASSEHYPYSCYAVNSVTPGDTFEYAMVGPPSLLRMAMAQDNENATQ